MIFEHELLKYHYQQAEQFNPPNKERYYTPKNSPLGPELPSITGVLGADPILRKKLEEWKLKVGQEEAEKISNKAEKLGN